MLNLYKVTEEAIESGLMQAVTRRKSCSVILVDCKSNMRGKKRWPISKKVKEKATITCIGMD